MLSKGSSSAPTPTPNSDPTPTPNSDPTPTLPLPYPYPTPTLPLAPTPTPNQVRAAPLQRRERSYRGDRAACPGAWRHATRRGGGGGVTRTGLPARRSGAVLAPLTQPLPLPLLPARRHGAVLGAPLGVGVGPSPNPSPNLDPEPNPSPNSDLEPGPNPNPLTLSLIRYWVAISLREAETVHAAMLLTPYYCSHLAKHT